ncbi:hypothetical protein C0J52_22486 [Blattella germanica]|nr:hypothetical protein C0J52_22486 [Blattella germanica]
MQLLYEQRKGQSLDKDKELQTKNDHENIVRHEFDLLSDKKSLMNRLKHQVNASMEAAKRDLEGRRQKLSLGNPLPRRAGEMYSFLAVVPWTASEQGELGVGCRSQGKFRDLNVDKGCQALENSDNQLVPTMLIGNIQQSAADVSKQSTRNTTNNIYFAAVVKIGTLRRILLEEESALTREYVNKCQQLHDQKTEEMKLKIQLHFLFGSIYYIGFLVPPLFALLPQYSSFG